MASFFSKFWFKKKVSKNEHFKLNSPKGCHDKYTVKDALE